MKFFRQKAATPNAERRTPNVEQNLERSFDSAGTDRAPTHPRFKSTK